MEPFQCLVKPTLLFGQGDARPFAFAPLERLWQQGISFANESFIGLSFVKISFAEPSGVRVISGSVRGVFCPLISLPDYPLSPVKELHPHNFYFTNLK